MIAIDTETHMMTPGNAAPPIVCLSWANDRNESGLIVDKGEMALFLGKLLDADELIAGANIAFDFAVIMRQFPQLTEKVFAAYERGIIFDVQIAEALNAIANGHHLKDVRRPGSPLQKLNPDGTFGKITNRYSLETCVWQVLGKKDAKANDTYRKRYSELDGVPLDQWPLEARQYPIDDAVNTLDVAVIQVVRHSNLGQITGKNWSHMTHQCRAALAMHLGAVRGLCVDVERVETLSAKVSEEYETSRQRLRELGFMKPDGKMDQKAIKVAVLKAHGADKPCPVCNGTGKVPSSKTKNKVNCADCGGTGLEIPPSITRTPSGGIAKDRDTLEESDIDELSEVAELTKIKKLKETYLPMLLEGAKAPLNTRANVLLETGRASYEGLVQLLPRKGGVRECFKAHDGFYLCSVDYSALELCTLAQVLYDLFGDRSVMAATIRETSDPGSLHTALAARMMNVDPVEFTARYKAKDKEAEANRQSAKAANFGFGGLMGAPKLVLAKRKEGIRFCELAGINEKCGKEKVMYWNDRELSAPTCPDCIGVASELRRQWLEQWPEMNEYFAYFKRYPGASTFGAQLTESNSIRTGFARAGLNLTTLCNHAFQHLAAMGAKHALWLVTKECYVDKESPLYGSRPLLFIHDEIIIEVPMEKADAAARRHSQVMIDAMREFTPDIPIVAEPTLMTHWYKDAKLAHDVEGKIIPWEPKK